MPTPHDDFRLTPILDHQAVRSMLKRKRQSPIRLSSTGQCKRQTTLLAHGKERAEADSKKARYLYTGGKIGRGYVERWEDAPPSSHHATVLQDGKLVGYALLGAELPVYLTLPDVTVQEALMVLELQHALDRTWTMHFVDGKPAVCGHVDLLCALSFEGDESGPYSMLTDFKSIRKGWAGKGDNKGFGFTSLKEDDYTTANESDLLQLGAYALALLEEADGAGDRTLPPRLIYENKDDQSTKEILVPCEIAWQYGMLARERWTEMLRAVAAGEILPPEYQPPDWHCNYCPVARPCWGEAIYDTSPVSARVPKWAFVEGHTSVVKVDKQGVQVERLPNRVEQ